MADQIKLPSYQELFGDSEAGGDIKGRSVLSPAAYLVDLMYLNESTNDNNTIESRRGDIYEIPLGYEATFYTLPYLDIVNSVLEKAVVKQSGEPDVDEVLRQTPYNFKLPFNFYSHKINLALEYLKSNSVELYKAFTATSYEVVAREYCQLSPEKYEILVQATESPSVLRAYWGLPASESLNFLTPVAKFLLASGLSGVALRELLYQNLSDTEISNGVSSRFFINGGGSDYLMLNADQDKIVLSSGGVIGDDYFDRIHRFIRLSEHLGWSFTELDWVLMSSCGGILDANAIQVIAVVKYLKETYSLSIDEICSFWGDIKNFGKGDKSIPQYPFDIAKLV